MSLNFDSNFKFYFHFFYCFNEKFCFLSSWQWSWSEWAFFNLKNIPGYFMFSYFILFFDLVCCSLGDSAHSRDWCRYCCVFQKERISWNSWNKASGFDESSRQGRSGLIFKLQDEFLNMNFIASGWRKRLGHGSEES